VIIVLLGYDIVLPRERIEFECLQSMDDVTRLAFALEAFGASGYFLPLWESH
jgi:hypothetical protein